MEPKALCFGEDRDCKEVDVLILLHRKRENVSQIRGGVRALPAFLFGFATALILAGGACSKGKGEGASTGAGSGKTGAAARPTRPARTQGRPAAPRPRQVLEAQGDIHLDGYEQAYSFLTNRVSGYFYQGDVLVADAGGPGFAKFVDGSWKNPWAIGQQVRLPAQPARAVGAGSGATGKARASFMSGLAGTLVLPVWQVGKAYKLVVDLATWSKGQYVTVMVNGKSLKSMPVALGRSLLTVEVPADRLHKGDNLIRFVFRKATTIPGTHAVPGIVSGMGPRKVSGAVRSPAAFLKIAWGPSATKVPTAPPVAFRQGAFALSAGSRMEFYLYVPKEGAKLALDAQAKAGSKLMFRVVADGKAPLEESWSLADTKQRLAADLAKFAGRAVRLSLVAGGSPVRVTGAALFTKKRAVATWTKKPVEYVFIWIADTLRRDAVTCLGAKGVKTPNFDAFCKKALVFSQATAPGNHSMPSHASFICGLYPPVHGFERAKRRMPTNVPFIYELFKKAGWITALFSSNGYVSDHWGFARGLDKYTNFIRENKANAAKYLWGAAKRWLKKQLGKKVFAYLATIDPHVTYDPPTSMLKLYYPQPYNGPIPRRVTGFYLEKIIRGVVKVDDPKDRKFLKALYLGEVTYNDEWFGHFMADLKEMGIADKSAVFLVADHGDQFWEHGSVGHGKRLYEEEIAIPLMVWWPGLQANPPRFLWDAEAIDILPTALELAGLPPDPKAQGASLLRLAGMTHVPAMLSAFSYNDTRSRSVRIGRYKLITHTPGRLYLFDLDKDPREQKNIRASQPVALRLVRTVFSLQNAYLPQWKKSLFGEASNLAPGFWTKGPGAMAGGTAGRSSRPNK